MCFKEQDQDVRGGGENAFCLRYQKAYMGGYIKVDKMTFTVLIKYQRVTCLGRHGQPKSQRVIVLGRDDLWQL